VIRYLPNSINHTKQNFPVVFIFILPKTNNGINAESVIHWYIYPLSVSAFNSGGTHIAGKAPDI
jgi:hypothetical protein